MLARQLFARSTARVFNAARFCSSEPPKAPPADEQAGTVSTPQGWDPEQEYEKTHPFYDPFYTSAIFEFEFEEGFVDSSAFMPPEDREVIQPPKDSAKA